MYITPAIKPRANHRIPPIMLLVIFLLFCADKQFHLCPFGKRLQDSGQLVFVGYYPMGFEGMMHYAIYSV